MSETISCLMPTFNRYPRLGWLVEEAVDSFLRQTDEDCELIVCNDAPGQTLRFDHPRVKIINAHERFATLSDKLQAAIDAAQGELLCRWDDDDISLPHRLAYSRQKLGDRLEWRAENYWYDTGTLRAVSGVGNTHITSLWRREALAKIGGAYPAKRSGDEDQAFNRLLAESGLPAKGELLPIEEIFYLYRWGTGSMHLSGKGGGAAGHQAHYDEIGSRPIQAGVFEIRPRWRRNHLARVQYACNSSMPISWQDLGGHFDWPQVYDRAVNEAHSGGSMVEVGCLSGRSLCYLGTAAKAADKRLKIYGVDWGVGASGEHASLTMTADLIAGIRKTGLDDIVSVIAAESTAAAEMFADDSLDFVFIDAAHDYQSVLADLQAWWPKVRMGGTIAGHDYHKPDDFPGVAQAVDRFFGAAQHSLTVNDCSSCWAKRK